jgi:hypothetical protein
MNQGRRQTEHLAAELANSAREYIDVAQDAGSAREQDALRRLCATLEYVLGNELESCEEWNGWVDGIVPAYGHTPDAVRVISHTQVSIRGYGIWGKSARGPFCIDPFFSVVHITEAGDAITGYDLGFGDTARGLGAVPYGKHLRWPDWFFPSEWLFRFSKASLRGPR